MKAGTEKYLIIVLFLFSLVLRLWGVGEFEAYKGDEKMHIPTAKNYIEEGHLTPENWYHPPLNHIFNYMSMEVLGDNSYGWRMKNVILGAVSVVVLFLLGKKLFADVMPALMAAAFLSIDPLHVLFSRSTFGEIPAALFFIVAVLFVLRYLEGDSWSLMIAGFSMGLAMAIKWYYAPAIAVLFLYILTCRYRDNKWSWVVPLHAFSVCVVFPLGIYLMTFYAWFGRGYDIMEFVSMQADALRELQSMNLEEFTFSDILTVSSTPWEWFIKPIIFGFPIEGSGAWSKYIMIMNNPPVWMLTMPAMLYLVIRAIKNRERHAFLVFILFGVTYLQFVIVKRPVFLYSAMSCLPLAFIAIAAFISSAINMFKRKPLMYGLVLTVLLAWGIYLYPLVSGKAVPSAFYAPVFSLSNLFR